MQPNYRQIQPAPVLDKTANAISVPYVNVQLFQSCTAQYEVRQITEIPPLPDGQVLPAFWGPILMSGSITLSGDDYTSWGTDDNFLYEKIAEKLGLTLIPLPTA
jgi:hypothetical protein